MNYNAVNDYLEELTEKIEGLTSVSKCEIYAGQLEEEDLSKVKLKLRQPEKCHVFVTIGDYLNITDDIRSKLYLDCEVAFFIVGLFDKQTIGYSKNCSITSLQIQEFMRENGFKIKGSSGFTQVGTTSTIRTALKGNKGYSVVLTTAIQRIDTSD